MCLGEAQFELIYLFGYLFRTIYKREKDRGREVGERLADLLHNLWSLPPTGGEQGLNPGPCSWYCVYSLGCAVTWPPTLSILKTIVLLFSLGENRYLLFSLLNWGFSLSCYLGPVVWGLYFLIMFDALWRICLWTQIAVWILGLHGAQ